MTAGYGGGGTFPTLRKPTVKLEPQTQVLTGTRQQGEGSKPHQQAPSCPLLRFAGPGKAHKQKSICHMYRL